MSADIPKHLRNRLVHHYQNFHASEQLLALSHQPFVLEPHIQGGAGFRVSECDRDVSYDYRQPSQRKIVNSSVLFKQYAALFEEGGFTLMDFGVDAEFGHCVDGLFIDLHALKPPSKRH